MQKQPTHKDKAEQDKRKDGGKLERLARKIDPPSREVSDEDLRDPGRMTPNSTPTDNRS